MSIQIFVTVLIAYLSQKLGVTFYLLGILLCLMVIDYLSGMAASAVEALDHPDDKSYGWSSRKGAKGIANKVAYLCDCSSNGDRLYYYPDFGCTWIYAPEYNSVFISYCMVFIK